MAFGKIPHRRHSAAGSDGKRSSNRTQRAFPGGERDGVIPGYDYRTAERRQTTAQALFEKAKNARTAVETEWTRYNDYYNFIHDVAGEVREYCEERGMPWTPAMCPDPWIMVESQIDPNVPDPEFRGRDDDRDSERAREREYAVKYIIENNDVAHKNTSNERRLLKLGDAFWKAYWDADMRCGPNEGDIAIADVSPESIFPDPSLRCGDLQAGQYLDYVYTMHKVAFWQTYRKRLETLGVGPDELGGGDYVPRESLFDLYSAVDERDDSVQVLEHWFKWPDDDTVEDSDGNRVSVSAGDVGCSIQAGGVELKLIPKYWKRTGKQCKLFPFVHYWRIRDENRFWNRSELYPIMDLVDAEDRKLSMTLLNDSFMANDIILMEEGALADGEELTNEPGATVRVKQNKIGAVARLGGLNPAGDATVLLNYLKEQIERTNRNYETNLGKETSRQTTAAGLAMLREDAGSQSDIKASDRLSGFERLYQLLDWLALEFFDDNRFIYLGADKEKRREEAIAFTYNAGNYAREMPAVYDIKTNEMVREPWEYFPKVDVTVTAGDTVIKGKQATLNALAALTQANVTADNWKLYAAQLEIMDLPDKQEIIDDWRRKFDSGVPAEVVQALGQDPGLLEAVEMALAQNGALQTQPQAIPGGAAITNDVLSHQTGVVM